MRSLAAWVVLGSTLVAGPARLARAADASLAGVWDATVVVGTLAVPFKFEIVGTGGTVGGHFFDGDVRVRSTRGSFANGTLVLNFDQYGSKIEATLADGRLEGRYDRGTRGAAYPFQAVRAGAKPRSGPVPSIGGEWRILLEKPTTIGESSWRFVVRQNGAEVTGAIMRVDGDTGTLSGTFKDGKVVLSHFSGARPTVIDVTPVDRSLLRIVQDGTLQATAVRPDDPRAKMAPAPADPTGHTRVIDPSAKFTFRFPDVDGRIVSSADARFQGKVVIVSITGTWCPNCHDEAPFLVQLYRTYRPKGLEIVALAFEEPEQLKDLSRVRSFIRQFGITYPFLIAGEPEQAPAKIPQAVNLNTFPAMFVLGRDGRVRATHAGYASKATGEFYWKEQKQFIAEIDRLLAERAGAPQ